MSLHDYSFPELWEMSDKRSEAPRVLALDPGHTTGWAFFRNHGFTIGGQIKTDSVPAAAMQLGALITEYNPSVVVYEEYRIYRGKTQQHQWSNVLTLRIIGSLQTICYMRDLPIYKQGAQLAKQFVTDDKLKSWRYYQKGEPHTRDAVRHGCYFLLFGGKDADKG